MEATQHHAYWENGSLNSYLESLLDAYEKNVGSKEGGVPAETLQGASRISKEHSRVHASGLAKCTKKDTAPDDDADTQNDEDASMHPVQPI